MKLFSIFFIFEYIDFFCDFLHVTYRKCLRTDVVNILILGRFNSSVELPSGLVFLNFLYLDCLVTWRKYYFSGRL